MHPQLQKLSNYVNVFDLYLLTFTIICSTTIIMVQGNAQTEPNILDNETPNNSTQLISNSTQPNLIEIGDRVWFDNDRDGIQSEVDTSLQGVEVSLYSNNILITTVTTDEQGHYKFSTNDNLDTDSTKYNLKLNFGTEYRISLDSLQANLGGYAPTFPNIQNNDALDSDGVKSNGLISIVFNTGSTSELNYNHDFGFTTGSFGSVGGLYPTQPDTNPCTVRETKQNSELQTECGSFGGAAPEPTTTPTNSETVLTSNNIITNKPKQLIRTGGSN